MSFNIDDFIQTDHWINAGDTWSFSAHWLHPDWALYCLTANIETAAGLTMVRNLSWVRGWDAARTLAEFAGENVPRVTSG